MQKSERRFGVGFRQICNLELRTNQTDVEKSQPEVGVTEAFRKTKIKRSQFSQVCLILESL